MNIAGRGQPQKDGMLTPLIDAHIHLDKYSERERAILLEESFAGGTEALVAVSMNWDSCHTTRQLAQQYPQRILPAYGFHPEQPLPEPEEEARLLNWIQTRHQAGEAFAIGEVGLPYYTRTEAQQQGKIFDETPYAALLERFVRLAADTGRPLVLHAVYEDAHKTCDLLEHYDVRKAHFHWFKGDETVLSRMEHRKFMISITPDVMYEEEIQEIVRRYPLELMMTETDGPWPFEGPFAARQTHPLMMQESVWKIAQLKKIEVEEAADILLNNARRFYGLGPQ